MPRRGKNPRYCSLFAAKKTAVRHSAPHILIRGQGIDIFQSGLFDAGITLDTAPMNHSHISMDKAIKFRAAKLKKIPRLSIMTLSDNLRGRGEINGTVLARRLFDRGVGQDQKYINQDKGRLKHAKYRDH